MIGEPKDCGHAEALDGYGTKSLVDVFELAIDLDEEGFPLTR